MGMISKGAHCASALPKSASPAAAVAVVAADFGAAAAAVAVDGAAVAGAAAAGTAVVVVTAEEGLDRIAMAIGQGWAHEIVRALRDDEREILGAWPGTLSEAKMRVLAHLNKALDIEVLSNLARVATVAARREWLTVAGRDPEA